MRMLIVDDHPLFRKGVRNALAETGDWEDIIELGSVAEAEAALSKGGYALVLLDLSLPDGSGFELIERHARMPGAPAFLVLSMSADRGAARKALKLGASGYASKGIDLPALILGTRLVAAGEIYVEGEILRDLLTSATTEPRGRPEAAARIDSLSQREREILGSFLEGHSTKETALELDLSQRTVENYQSALYAKLGVAGPVDLVKLAYRAGVFDPS